MALYPNGPTPYGNATALGITAATVVKAAPGVVVTVSVIVAGSAAGAIYDATSTSGNSATNQVAPILATAGTYAVKMPCTTGIVVIPGTGQTVAISYD